LIDFTASQAQSSAEQACPFRETIRVDADHGGGVVRHDGHPRLHDGTAMAFVGEVPCAAVQQAGNETFAHGSAGPTRLGALPLGRRPDAAQVRLVQAPEDVLRWARWGEGSDGFRHPHGENAPLVPHFTRGGVMQGQIARQRVDGRDGTRPDPRDRLLHLRDQGRHIPRSTRIPHGERPGQDEARRRLGDPPGLTATRGGTVAFALTNGGNGGIRGVDDLAVGQGLAVGQASRLVCDPVMRLKRGPELGVQACPLPLRQVRRAVQARVSSPRQRQDRLSSRQQVRFRLAYQCHNHLPQPSALAPEAVHPLGEGGREVLHVGLPRRALGDALGGYGREDLEDFFGALYRVAASLTRGLPGSRGKVSTPKCARLPRPSASAVAAW
jgi:hypothetical protein